MSVGHLIEQNGAVVRGPKQLDSLLKFGRSMQTQPFWWRPAYKISGKLQICALQDVDGGAVPADRAGLLSKISLSNVTRIIGEIGLSVVSLKRRVARVHWAIKLSMPSFCCLCGNNHRPCVIIRKGAHRAVWVRHRR